MDERKYKSDLWSQLKGVYGKLLYTYVTQQKQLWLISRKQSIIGWTQIILTAISTVGFLSIVFTNTTKLAVAAGICSVLSLVLNLYSRSANMGELISRHKKTVDSLWPIVQDYISLLTDFWNNAGIDEIKLKRQELQNRTEAIYKEAPRTGYIAYYLARKALKVNNEQSFTDSESDIFLPEELKNRK